MILIFDNLISENQANYCIQKAMSSKPTIEHHGRFCYSNEQLFMQDEPFRDIMGSIISQAKEISSLLEVDWSEINYWPSGSHHVLHQDTASIQTTFASITYLNVNYRGGETYFEDGTTISPQVGRTVFFDGINYKHGVRSICHGERFTLPIWYKTID